ncbi:MAG: OmpH family outer membrane protein [Gammaproteobacteria bacterium]|nr:OmpH family outer membrane protein [Gammaproteobacteria bacterium]
MNKRLLLCTFAALLFTGFTQAADLQIGVVNVRAVASQAPQRETISAALQNEFKERGEGLKALEKEIKDMQAKGQADELTMSEQQKTDLIRSIQGKASDFKLQQQAFQEDFKARSEEEQRKLLILIKKAIDQVALQDKFDIVLQSESVAYISARVDITNKVVTLMSDPKFN